MDKRTDLEKYLDDLNIANLTDEELDQLADEIVNECVTVGELQELNAILQHYSDLSGLTGWKLLWHKIKSFFRGISFIGGR